MEYQVETHHQQRQPYVAVRTTTPMAAIGTSMGELFGRLYGWLGAHHETATGAPWARYLSVGPDEVEVEVAAPVRTEAVGDGGVSSGVLPACEVATTLHVGPYDHLEDAYAAVSTWLQAHGRQPSGAMWEVYLNGPDTEPDPGRWKTLVCYPYMPA